MLSEMEERMTRRITDLGVTMQVAVEPRAEVNKDSVLEPNALLWTHYLKGGVHPVPEGWILNKNDCAGHSTLTVKALWELWCFGHPVHRIPPYRKLISKDLSCKGDKIYLSKCAGVMNMLISIACDEGVISDVCELEVMTTIQRDDVFTKAFNDLNDKLAVVHNRDNRRVGELKIITYYNSIQKLKKS